MISPNHPEQLHLFTEQAIGKRLRFSEALAIDWEYYGQDIRGAKMELYKRKKLDSKLGSLWIDEMSENTINTYWRERSLEGLSATGIKRELVVLRAVFNRLKKWKRYGSVGIHRASDWILPADNPGTFMPRVNERDFDRERVLSVEEWESFKPFCTERVLNICTMALLTQLRKSDLRLLNLKKLVMINDRPFFKGIQQKTITPRNPSGKPYKIFANPRALEIIRKFPQGLDFTNFEHEFPAAVKEWGGVPFQYRDLRRSAAVRLKESGVHLSDIQKTLGHGSPNTTMIYTTTTNEHLARAGKILEETFG